MKICPELRYLAINFLNGPREAEEEDRKSGGPNINQFIKLMGNDMPKLDFCALTTQGKGYPYLTELPKRQFAPHCQLQWNGQEVDKEKQPERSAAVKASPRVPAVWASPLHSLAITVDLTLYKRKAEAIGVALA